MDKMTKKGIETMSGFDRLRIEIVLQAVKDYRQGLNCIGKTTPYAMRKQRHMKDAEKFLKGEYAQMFIKSDIDSILEYMQEESDERKKSCDKKREKGKRKTTTRKKRAVKNETVCRQRDD